MLVMWNRMGQKRPLELILSNFLLSTGPVPALVQAPQCLVQVSFEYLQKWKFCFYAFSYSNLSLIHI